MLDIRFLRERLDEVVAMMERRGQDPEPARRAGALDERRRQLLTQVEGLRHKRREASQDLAPLERGKEALKGASTEELEAARRERKAQALRDGSTGELEAARRERKAQVLRDAGPKIAEMRRVGDEINALDAQLRQVEQDLEQAWLLVPNMPEPEVLPVPAEGQPVRSWGEPREFSFEPLAHWDLGERLEILDFERAAKIAGARFTLFRGAGARLERALINFMLDLHTTQHGYTELLPPFLVSAETATGSGSLPRSEADMFRCREGYYLIPTAEMPLASLHRDEILGGDSLPLRYVAYTPCFRSEAGAAGRDTRGLIRQHQFDKVELFKFTAPERSSAELESLVVDAEEVLQRLGLHYRVVLLPLQDIAPQSAKTYDIELWAPGVHRWLEVSSCSNCRDYQARRTNTRFRPEPRGKPEFVHTLNGSGVALARLVVTILEVYQNADGTISLPEVLGPYLGGRLLIESA